MTSGRPSSAPVLAFTQGDPAGVGPLVLARVFLSEEPAADFVPLLVAERAVMEAAARRFPELAWDRLTYLSGLSSKSELESLEPGSIAVLDPVGEARSLSWGSPGAADAAGCLAALDAGSELAASGRADAVVTSPLSKSVVAKHALPDFTGHTDYLASRAGLERYGRDYLMAFLAPDLQVALLSMHLPLRAALDAVTGPAVGAALDCLARCAGGRVAVAGLNPHAGEGGLLGYEDIAVLEPAVEAAVARGIDVSGPHSADSLFSRARRGEFDWVLALYHDQGLIAVKTVDFGTATNWTMGLPYLRTSVDHGTAYDAAVSGQVDSRPMRQVIATTLGLIQGRLPRQSEAEASGSGPEPAT